MILTAGSDSNHGEQVGTVPYPHGRPPAGGGHWRTSGHRFRERGILCCSEVQQPSNPNETPMNSTMPLGSTRGLIVTLLPTVQTEVLSVGHSPNYQAWRAYGG